MKFTIQQLKGPFPVKTKFGPAQKYQIVSGGQTYDAWVKSPFTDSFQVGYSFEAELKGAPYKGVDSIVWPKAQTSNVGQSSAQLDRIEAKIDQLLGYSPNRITPVSNDHGVKKLEMPYADSPFPKDDDYQG